MTSSCIAALLEDARIRLTAVSDTPRLDAEVLLACSLNKPRSHLRAWPERVADIEQAHHFAELLTRRLQGRPVAHLVGRREFWSLDLQVTPATLIPRPETELLVELALARLPVDQPVQVADLGTGSGAIALAIARERPRIRIVATDYSTQALAVAEQNARRLGTDNVQFRQGDWCAALGKERFALIVSNPPYLADTDIHLSRGDVRFEPRCALTAGRDGLDAIRTIVAQAGQHLNLGGWLLLEHGFDQGEAVPALLRDHGFSAIESHRDLAGLDRVSGGRM